MLAVSGGVVDAQGCDCAHGVAMVKAVCGELVNDVLSDCEPLQGGVGPAWDSALEHLVRDVGGAIDVMLAGVATRL